MLVLILAGFVIFLNLEMYVITIILVNYSDLMMSSTLSYAELHNQKNLSTNLFLVVLYP